MPEERLYLLDTFAFIFRSYFANPRLKNGAAYTFARIALQLLEKHKPTHIAAVFDTPEPTFRHEIYPDYKANRDAMPEDLRPQIPLIRQLIEAMNIPIVELPGFEADDVMGTLAKRAAADGLGAVIVSPDKDLLQLVDDAAGITVLNTKDGEVWHDNEGVKARMGVYPNQVVDYLSLLGDASDNVKGVPGIGEKGAAQLLEKYGSLEGVLAAKAELKPKQREGLETASEWLDQTKRLVTVVTDLDLPTSPRSSSTRAWTRRRPARPSRISVSRRSRRNSRRPPSAAARRAPIIARPPSPISKPPLQRFARRAASGWIRRRRA